MKPTANQVSEKFIYAEGNLFYRNDAKRGKPVKAGDKAGSLSRSGTFVVSINGKYWQSHHAVWAMHNGCWPDRTVRHMNGNLLDNRIENLFMDSSARGRRDAPLNVNRLNEVLSYDSETGEFSWKISPRNRTLPGDKAGYMNDGGYMMCVIDKQKIRLHHAAWAMSFGEMPDGNLDHINGVRHDNRISNLRIATKSQNMQNTAVRQDNKTGIKGVHFRKDTGKYSAQIVVDGKATYLGCFDSLEGAENARLQAEIELHPFRAIGRIKD